MKVETIVHPAGAVMANSALVYEDGIKTPRPLLLMSTNWFGMTEEAIERTATMIGKKYIGFVVDMYGRGKITVGRDEASKYANGLRKDPEERRSRIVAGLDAFIEEASARGIGDVTKVAAVGFCFGGGNVLELARMGAPVGAVICVHGDLLATRPAQAGDISARVLVIHGSLDPVVPKDHRDRFEAEMDEAEANWQILNFGGLLHSFAEREANTPGIEVYDRAAADQTYRMIEDYLDHNL